jgi:acyl-CoA reductase-like NAD-dependent aldehyde dehydrogenase
VSAAETSAAARAVAGARHAVAGWARLEPGARARPIALAARLLADEADGLAETVAGSSRCSVEEAWTAEIVPTLDALRWLAAAGPRALQPRALRGSTLQWYFRATRHRLHWDPHGVVGVVTPANRVLFTALPQVAAALVAGNAVVWKPAPAGAAVAVHVTSVLYRAGVPAALLRVVPGGPAAAAAVVAAGVDLLHFTGGAGAGRALYLAQARHGRPAILELSGRHVAVVLAPADAARVAGELTWAKRAGDGRDCVAVQLVLAEASVHDALREALAAAHRDERAGRRSAEEQRRLAALVEDALRAGAKLVAGAPGGAVVLTGVHPGMRVVDEEVAGPVLGLAAVQSAGEALARVNGSPWRLSASVWSADTARARRLAAGLDVGQVWINTALHPTAQPEVTLAGRGASGFGPTRGLPGLMAMAHPRVVSEAPLRARPHWSAPPAAVRDLVRATVHLRFARGLRGRLSAAVTLARALGRLARATA